MILAGDTIDAGRARTSSRVMPYEYVGQIGERTLVLERATKWFAR